MDNQLIDIEKYIEKEGNKSFFVALISPKYKLVNYEVKMIQNNSSNNSLIMSISKFNEKIKLRYDIGNKISLDNYLKGRNISKSEFVLIMKNMIKVLNSYEEMILESGIEFLNLEDIYIDVDTKEMVIIYIPIDYTGDKEIVEVAIKEFIKFLYIEYVDVDLEDTDDKFDKLIQLARDKDSTISDLYNLLLDKPEERIASKIVDTKTSVNLGSGKKMANLHNRELNIKTIKEEKENRVNLKRIITAESITGILILLIYKMDLLDKSYIKLLIDILALLNMLIIVTSFGVKKDIKIIKSKGKYKENEIDISNDSILSKGFKRGYIILNHDETTMKVVINKERFKIGRMVGEVDLITKSKTIGKIHCEIIKDGEKYYIVDLNSKNGTYLNGIRLKSNNMYVLKSGDALKLADVDGKFEIC